MWDKGSKGSTTVVYFFYFNSFKIYLELFPTDRTRERGESLPSIEDPLVSSPAPTPAPRL